MYLKSYTISELQNTGHGTASSTELMQKPDNKNESIPAHMHHLLSRCSEMIANWIIEKTILWKQEWQVLDIHMTESVSRNICRFKNTMREALTAKECITSL